jgi:HAD superfamily hydrolase (TIGR01490 family)
MRLALFDLDHTLIPYDSGHRWTSYLSHQGILGPEAPERYIDACRDYASGRMDIRTLHRATVAPLGRFERAEIDVWLQGFALHIASELPAPARAWVEAHQAVGDTCVLVTATTRFIAEVFARGFGIAHVLATEAQTDPARDHRYTGEVVGLPCFREHKPDHVQAWLAQRGLTLATCERSWFYSDSINDLPLLEAVTDPVVVHPDTRLQAVARERGWPERMRT